ncbi:MAG: 1-acyl-sn-glycerol-3-phosphate acyltransferase [Planctomyces sp.]|nr:1-acyl-sn-glycerol-3-phosphate acyltransferase [Planctomyces sp.]
MQQLTAACLRVLTGLRAEWRGCLPSVEPRVYFANHTSHLDAPAIWASLPAVCRANTRPVAAQDYWSVGPVRRFIAGRVMNAILIDRKLPTARNNPVNVIRQAVEEGASVIVFPEGTRSPDGRIQDFKSGLYHLAKDLPHVEFVPIYLENLNRILPKGEFIPLPIIARATFGTPLGWIEAEHRHAFLNRAKQSVIDLMQQVEMDAMIPHPANPSETFANELA